MVERRVLFNKPGLVRSVALCAAASLLVVAQGVDPAGAAVPTIRDTRRGGYDATPTLVQSVRTTTQVSQVTCGSEPSGAGPIVGLTSGPPPLKHIAGLLYSCDGGSLRYSAGTRVNGISNIIERPIAVGDVVVLSAVVANGTVTARVRNVTQGWTQAQSGPAGTIDKATVGMSTRNVNGQQVAARKLPHRPLQGHLRQWRADRFAVPRQSRSRQRGRGCPGQCVCTLRREGLYDVLAARLSDWLPPADRYNECGRASPLGSPPGWPYPPIVSIPVLEPMLATNRQLTDGHRWAIEPKLDGWRALVYVDGGVKVRTRSGRNVTASLPELAGIAEQVPDGTVLDGELVAGGGRRGRLLHGGSVDGGSPTTCAACVRRVRRTAPRRRTDHRPDLSGPTTAP